MEIKYLSIPNIELIEATKIQWKHSMRRSFKTLFICIFFAVAFTLWGILPEKSSQFWNFKTSMGIAYIMVSVIYGLGLYQSRTQWISNCAKEIGLKANTEFIFTVEKIIIKSSDSYGESTWAAITSYRIHNNFLFLYIRALESTWMTINQKNMSEIDFSTLATFVSSKIPLKK